MLAVVVHRDNPVSLEALGMLAFVLMLAGPVIGLVVGAIDAVQIWRSVAAGRSVPTWGWACWGLVRTTCGSASFAVVAIAVFFAEVAEWRSPRQFLIFGVFLVLVAVLDAMSFRWRRAGLGESPAG